MRRVLRENGLSIVLFGAFLHHPRSGTGSE